MKTLIFDTETTGFPSNHAPLSDPIQPHLIQLAALLTVEDVVLQKFETIIQCPIEVPEAAFKVHGISMEKSQAEGVPLATALAAFNDLLFQADRLVAHNMRFDLKLMEIAYARANIAMAHSMLEAIPKVCTMITVSPIMKREGKRYTLDSSYRHFVDPAGFSSAHDASADTMACFKLLRAMEKKEIRII
ncbi:hypothetical protein LCGC14_2643980 [marine sediment metagenome]|uniref:Exonuclease domain-containing protein n=1 Tax=marine sediment metagenome TaxID=412755 RepID=A0A0F8ZWQ8_9ZZZZ